MAKKLLLPARLPGLSSLSLHRLFAGREHCAAPTSRRLSTCIAGVLVTFGLTVFGMVTLTGCTDRSQDNLFPLLEETEVQPGPAWFAEESEARAQSLAAGLSIQQIQGKQQQTWQALGPTLRQSLTYAQAREDEQVAAAHGYVAITWGDVARSLSRLEQLLPQLDADSENIPCILARNFRWIRLTEGAQFSGYYEPVIEARSSRQPGFTQPLYQLPPDLQQLNLGDFNKRLAGQRVSYRMENGPNGQKPVPYYTRAEIDGKSVLAGKKLELAWVDPLDAFFLQVQGSGRIHMPNGAEILLSWAGTNGRAYTAIGPYMADLGLIDTVSMQSIRGYLNEHPDEMNDILFKNERYTFFAVNHDGTGPIGSMGVPLTPYVSLATDTSTFPLGALLVYDVSLPGSDQAKAKQVKRLGIAQDTGEAIRDRRIDLFCGQGDTAAFVAGHLNCQGEVWLLLAKD